MTWLSTLRTAVLAHLTAGHDAPSRHAPADRPHDLAETDADIERDIAALVRRAVSRRAQMSPQDAGLTAAGLTAAAVATALHAAVGAIYFDDRSDYHHALWTVVRALDADLADLLMHDERDAYRIATLRHFQTPQDDAPATTPPETAASLAVASAPRDSEPDTATTSVDATDGRWSIERHGDGWTLFRERTVGGMTVHPWNMVSFHDWDTHDAVARQMIVDALNAYAYVARPSAPDRSPDAGGDAPASTAPLTRPSMPTLPAPIPTNTRPDTPTARGTADTVLWTPAALRGDGVNARGEPLNGGVWFQLEQTLDELCPGWQRASARTSYAQDAIAAIRRLAAHAGASTSADATASAALEADVRQWFAEVAGTDSTGAPVIQQIDPRDVLIELRYLVADPSGPLAGCMSTAAESDIIITETTL